MHIASHVTHLRQLTGNILFPPRCGLCRNPTEQHGKLCGPCFRKLDFLTKPLCHMCGYPFPYDMDDAALCGECMRHPPLFDAHRSAVRYDDGSSQLIHMLKYYDQPTLLPLLANWLTRAAKDFLEIPNIIIAPVPIHPWRLIKRRYNQAALLSQELATQSSLPIIIDGLRRTKHRAPQASLSRAQRLKNTKGVFIVSPQRHNQISGRPILLVDDVMTTGATLNACAKELRRAGASHIFAATIARTVLE